LTISAVNKFGPETPIKTSLPETAVDKSPVKLLGFVNNKNSFFDSFKSNLSLEIIPFESTIIISIIPYSRSNFAMAVPAAPAPTIVTVVVSGSLPDNFKELIKAAKTTIAVPC